MRTLGGFIGIRNGISLDYCWELAAQSLLGVCDEVVICDSDSDDGTRQAIDQWAAKEPRITVCNFPWTDPKGDALFWVRWLNYARQHLKMKDGWCVYVDADEILHENSYAKIRQASEEGRTLMVHRLNFWGDAKHLIPHHECCGFEVIRVGSQYVSFPSDSPTPESGEIEALAVRDLSIEIMHYGFLRRRTAFFKKAREVSRIWVGENQFDPRLEHAEQFAGNWSSDPSIADWVDRLIPFEGTHPKIAWQWLRDRGLPICEDGRAL